MLLHLDGYVDRIMLLELFIKIKVGILRGYDSIDGVHGHSGQIHLLREQRT